MSTDNIITNDEFIFRNFPKILWYFSSSIHLIYTGSCQTNTMVSLLNAFKYTLKKKEFDLIEFIENLFIGEYIIYLFIYLYITWVYLCVCVILFSFFDRILIFIRLIIYFICTMPFASQKRHISHSFDFCIL